MKRYIIGICAVLFVAVAYYAISPLFRNKQLDEALPTLETQVSATSSASTDNPFSTLPVTIAPTAGHPASGTVRIVSDGDNHFVRYEDFKTINGPDIFVYLSKDLSASKYVSLGRVKATEGNINYSIPDEVDPREYPYVLVWCKTFGVLFNSARVY